MRYVGQEYTVAVDIAADIDLAAVDAAFHDAHRIRYGHSTPGAPVEFVSLRVAAFGRIAADDPPYRAPAEGLDPERASRPAVFAGERHETTVVLRDRLRPGERRDGPLVVEEESATTVVPPGYTTVVDDHGNLLITRAR
jgi:N-methylhydantoinase A